MRFLRSRFGRFLGLLVGAGVLFFCLLLSVRFGAAQIATADVVSAFTDYDGSEEDLIIRTLRVPRALIAAFVGAALYLLAWKGRSSPLRLILIGIGLGAIASALTTIMIVFGDIRQVSQALIWLTGSVYCRGWEHIWPLLPWLLVASVALAGAAVATAGTIGFVSLSAPHVARMLAGPSHSGLLPASAMTGGILAVVADLVGRVAFGVVEIPAGIITSAIGAPFFPYLLYRNRNK